MSMNSKNVGIVFVFIVACCLLISVALGRVLPQALPSVSQVTWYSDLVLSAPHVSKPMTRLQLKELLDHRWGRFDKFKMSNGTVVNDCHEALLANKYGLHVEGNADDWGIYHVRSIACYAAQTILNGVAQKVSYLSGFQMTAADARGLPAALYPVTSSYETVSIRLADKHNKTLVEVMGKREVFQVWPNPHGNAPMVRVSGGGSVENIRLLARGDFNGDGIEDLLVVTTSTVGSDSLDSEQNLYLITRLGPHRAMKVLRVYPDMGLGFPLFE